MTTDTEDIEDVYVGGWTPPPVAARIPPGKEWAFRMVANADAGHYPSRSMLPLKWAREVVARHSK